MTFTLKERGKKYRHTIKHTLQVLYDCRICSSLHSDFFFLHSSFWTRDGRQTNAFFLITSKVQKQRKKKKVKSCHKKVFFFLFFFSNYTLHLSDLLASQKEHNSFNKCYDNTPLRRDIENVEVFYVCTKCKGLLFCTALRETHCIWYCA